MSNILSLLGQYSKAIAAFLAGGIVSFAVSKGFNFPVGTEAALTGVLTAVIVALAPKNKPKA